MKRCSRCILPETFPGITFDQNGVCNKCYEHDRTYGNRNFEQLKLELESIFEWAKKQKKPYDCVVPFSGGKDSTYVLYICRKVYGLKVVAVNFNNGLQTKEAIENIKNIGKRLDVTLLTFGPPWELMRKLYALFLKKTGQFCFPCDMGIWATVHYFAEKLDVPLIVSGFSQQIEARGRLIYSYSNKLFKKVTDGVITPQEQKYFLEEELLDKLIRRVKHLTLTRYRRQISLPDYMKWDDKEIKETIARELGWISQDNKRTDHVDCLFAPMKNYLMIQKWGFGEKTTKYSAMIRDGQINREEALKRIEKEEPKEPPPEYETFKEMLGVTDKDIESAKYKSHLDYL